MMTITKLYTKYFQKSKVFLYPLLGFPRGIKYKPFETYIDWKDENYEVFSLYCRFKDHDSSAFQKFESEKLGPHKLLRTYYKLEDDTLLYVFNLEHVMDDYIAFMRGRYSQISEETKEIIVNFFTGDNGVKEYIESYLYPEYYYDDYAKILDVSEVSLRNVGELCDKPDLAKESLNVKTKTNEE